MQVHAPAVIGLKKKSLYSSTEERIALKLAINAARGVDRTLPVIFGNRIIAWVRGKQFSDIVQVAPIADLNTMINAATVLGQKVSEPFCQISSQGLTVNAWYDYFPCGPGGGTYTGTALTARQFTDTSTGALAHGGNVSPAIKTLTSAWAMTNNVGGVLMLYDRVLAYEACTINGALQSMTNTLVAQRYATNVDIGLQIMCTTQTVPGAANNVSALIYTDQTGNTAQSAPVSSPVWTLNTTVVTPSNMIPAQAVLRYANGATSDILFLPLRAGDSGVQKIESFTTSASTTGTICFSLVHPIAYFPMPSAGVAGQYDLLRQLATLERIYDGAALYFAINASNSSSANIQGALDFVWA